MKIMITEDQSRHYPEPGSGLFQLLHTAENGVVEKLGPALPNSWMYTWGTIAARVLGKRDLSYIPGTLYVEFENVGSPSTAVVVPTVTRSDGIDYYLGLASSSTRDYLRVPTLLEPSIDVDPDFTTLLDPTQGNRLTLLARTAGATGVNGRSFGYGSNSKICGLAWVATPVPDDATQDVVFARQYYQVSDQIVVPSGGQLDVTYLPTFG